MIAYDIEIDRESLRDAISLFEFIGGNTAKAERVAINKTGRKVRSSTALPGGGASQRIRSQVRLKASYVNDRLTFQPASDGRLIGRITAPSSGLLLSRFSTDTQIASEGISWVSAPEVPPRGIRVKVKPGGPIKVVQGDSETTGEPFYLVLSNSRALGIAARRRFPGPRGGELKVFYGPSLSLVWKGEKDDMLPVAQREFNDQMVDAMRFLLQRRYPQE